MHFSIQEAVSAMQESIHLTGYARHKLSVILEFFFKFILLTYS